MTRSTVISTESAISLPADMQQDDPKAWIRVICQAISIPNGQPLAMAKQAIRIFPTEGMILHLACLAALVEQKPKEFPSLQRRLHRHFEPLKADHLLMAVYHAQSGQWTLAALTLEKYDLSRTLALRVANVFWEGIKVGGWIRLGWRRFIGVACIR